MDLSKPSEENISFMLEEIKMKLRMVNGGAIRASDIDESKYDDLKDIHEMVQRKNNFSTIEMNAIIEELSNLRK